MLTNSLPEDLAPLPHAQRRELPVATILRSGISLSPAALALIGMPERVDVLLGSHSRMLGVKPNPGGKLRVKYGLGGRASTTGLIQLTDCPRRLQVRLPRRGGGHVASLVFRPRLAEGGVLLFGPLPEAAS